MIRNLFLFFYFFIIYTNANSSNLSNNSSLKNAITEYLSEIKTISANMRQVISFTDKTIAPILYKGEVALKKPHYFLCEYGNQDDNFKLIVDGNIVKILDKKTNQMMHLNQEQKNITATMLLNSESEEISKHIDKIFINGNTLNACTIEKESSSELCIQFDYKANKINRINRISMKYPEVEINIELYNIILNKEINDEKFIIQDPRLFDDQN